ncbi:kinetochore protein NDC80 homolog [Diachasma alloeum]|uniref:kinetochore protein NDC80 homolog n=1 Tax=Diachasma alloeum TaxID=454923 RepID=UPI0007383F84|nr:kinetochore protein NDC80 homolog [Diachasma alloeum]
MRPTSVGRKSSLNPVRVSTLADKGSARGDSRKTLKQRGSSVGDSSQIPRPRIRNDSTERSSIRPSTSRATATPVTNLRPPSEIGSLARGRSPSAERASVLGTTKGTKKDTRPLNDKSYQNLMLSRIDNFFSDTQKSSMLNTTGSLKPVSLKIFVNASDFLLKLLEYKQELNLTNYMEELPKIAKKLHYPGVMAKSWLKTANTMHSFPHVLAWLSWLVEICEVKDFANQTFQLNALPFNDCADGEVINRSLFLSLLELYQVWNDGKEDEEKALEDKYIDGMANQCGFTDEDVEQAQAELEETLRKEQALLQDDQVVTDQLNELTEKLKMLTEDESKQTAHSSAQAKYLTTIEAEMQQLDAESQLYDREKRKYEDKHDELNAIIQQQAMNIEERDEIVHQCSQIQGYMNSFDDHLEEIQKEAWALDMKASKARDQFDKAILAFNRDIVINVTNDIAGDLDELKMPETFPTRDIVEALKQKAETINNVKNTIKRELNSCQTFIDKQSTKLETLLDKIKIQDQEKNEMVLKSSETRQYIKKLKENAKEEVNKWQDVIQKAQAEIKELQQSCSDDQVMESELAEAQEKLDAVMRRKVHLEQSAQRFFAKFFEILASHRNELHKQLTKCQTNSS